MSQIVKTNKINDVLNYIDQDTLAIFDVDNTLIEPSISVGGVAWFEHHMKRLQKNGLPEKEAIKQIYTIWSELQHIVGIRAVEETTAQVIAQLHERQIKTMGLTARGFTLSRRTTEQLFGVGIALHDNTLHDKEIVLDKPHVGFYQGILSIPPYGNKGTWLRTFFDKIRYWPKKVIFVDDHRPYLAEVQSVFDEQKIAFTGFHYGAAQDRTVKFDPARVDLQARELLKKRGKAELLSLLS